MAIPDFFLVGAPKSATSSLHLLLIQHPRIFMCDPKEPHFFCTDFPGLAEVQDREGYEALFAAAPAGACLGEASAHYLSSTEAAANIHAANPDARIILSIRNPVDAAHSFYHQMRDAFRENQFSFAEAWDLQQVRAMGQALPSYCPEPAQLQYQGLYSYHDQIARYVEVFGQEAVKVLMFEDIRDRPQEVLAEVLDFIGVPPFEEEATMPTHNSRRVARFPALSQMMAEPPAVLRPLVRPVKAALNRFGIQPSAFTMKHLSRPATAGEKAMDPDLRARVQEAFAPDVARLERLLDRDLGNWKS